MTVQIAQPPAPSRKRRWPRRVLTVLIILAPLYAIYRFTLYRMVEDKLDAIRKQGYPVTLADLDKWYTQPPPGENAADVYMAAFAQLKWAKYEDRFPKSHLLPIIGDAQLPAHSDPLSEQIKEAISEYLAGNDVALKLLHKATAMKQCRYPVDLTQGVKTILSHLTKGRQAARLLELDAIRHAEQVEPGLATSSVLDSMHFAHSLSNEPLLISHLFQMSCYASTVSTLERVISRTVLENDQLTQLDAAIQSAVEPKSAFYAFVGERCFGSHQIAAMTTKDLVDLISLGVGVPMIARWSFPLYRESGLLELDHLCYLELTEDFIGCIQMLPHESVRARKILLPIAKKRAKYHVFAEEDVVVWATAMTKGDRLTARLLAARSAVAVERRRLAASKLPENLDELVPAYIPTIPTDPFNGQPLRYRKLSKGYVGYSVGEDGTDDGGDEKKDITFTVER